MEKDLSPSSSPRGESPPLHEDQDQLESIFGIEDMEDPFPCPTFDLSTLDNTDQLLERESVTANMNLLSNVAVLASSGIEEGLGGRSSWKEDYSH